MPIGEHVTRDIMGNVPPWLAGTFYAMAALACGFATFVFVKRFLRYRLANRAVSADGGPRSVSASVGSILLYLTFHKQLLRDRYAGTAHLLMFYGFFILFVGTCLVLLEHDTPLHFFYGRFYLVASLVIDLGGVVFLIGLVMFLWRRHARRSDRILGAWWVAVPGWLLLAIGISGFLLEGLRITYDIPDFERWSSVGYGVAMGLRSLGIQGEVALLGHRIVWAGHALLCVLFFALLPWKFFSHIVYGPLSWATRTVRPHAELRLPLGAEESPGALTWKDLSWRDLLQADACTTCGRCNEVCPAAAAGKPLRPREVVLGVREAIDADLRRGHVAGGNLDSYIPDDVIWSCTTCAACNEACPVGIEVFDKIIEMRRGRVEMGSVPDAAEQVFENSSSELNPYGKPNADRLLWAHGLQLPVAEEREPIELLYWVGCAGSFDPEGRSVARSMIKILNHLGVNYRVLGHRERCTGDAARRMGEEGLFQELARQNIACFAEHSVKHIVTHCPHCFNTFANEYRQLRSRLSVEHHSQFLARMRREGKLKLRSNMARSVTFHDPCYLGRGNGETDAPREVLQAFSDLNLIEMPHSRSNSFCCGAGGGSMWLEVKGANRIENIRTKEAVETGADIVATACPFCKTMLESGNQALENGPSINVLDIAELIVQAEGL